MAELYKSPWVVLALLRAVSPGDAIWVPFFRQLTYAGTVMRPRLAPRVPLTGLSAELPATGITRSGVPVTPAVRLFVTWAPLPAPLTELRVAM